jgi:hypothetical protein
MKSKIGYYLVLFVGIITCLSFIPHAFLGMKAVIEHINKGEIQTVAANGMQQIWLYSSVTMLFTGIWLLFLSKPFLNGDKKARIQVFIIGFGLSFFGVGCSYISSGIDGMIAFTVQGVILLIASIFLYSSEVKK